MGGLGQLSDHLGVVYELDYMKPQTVLYVIPIQNILGKLPVVPVATLGLFHRILTIRAKTFPAPVVGPGTEPGSGDGCQMRFGKSWALIWSSDNFRYFDPKQIS